MLGKMLKFTCSRATHEHATKEHAHPVITHNCGPQIEKRQLPCVNGGGLGARVRTDQGED